MLPHTPATRTPKRTPNARKQQQMDAATALGYAWRTAVSRRQKAAWAALAKITPAAQAASNGKPVSAYLLFFLINTARQAQNLPAVYDAFPFPDPPPFLGKVTVQAAVTAPSVLSLAVGGVDFPHAVQVFASKPLLSPADVSDATRYALVVTLPRMTLTGNDIGADYARLGTVEEGDAIALKFVPLSLSGFRGTPQKTVCVAEARPAP